MQKKNSLEEDCAKTIEEINFRFTSPGNLQEKAQQNGYLINLLLNVQNDGAHRTI